MIDFRKKIKNSNKFRKACIQFQSTGSYCSYPAGTTEYFQFWDEETRRCLDGYEADDGDYITGYNYFYLNYCPINRQVWVETTNRKGERIRKKEQKFEFPDFWDYDYFYFTAVDEAQEQGKHLCVLKSRRKGYSFKGAAMMCRNYYLIPSSKSYVYASNKQYLTEDGVLTKAWDYMDFIDKNTAWGKKRSVDTALRKRAGFTVKDEYGKEVEMGYKSEIIGVTLKDNPDIVRGKKANLILFEEAGSFKELGAAWQIARPSVEIDEVAFAPMIAYGTGGDEGSNFQTLKDMFYNPDGYNCLPLENIWDEAATNQCGFFIPQYANVDVRDDDGKRLYMDDDGNTLKEKAVQYILQNRQKVIESATNSAAIDRYVAERPITPKEAMLEFNGNIFPKKEILEQLSLLRTNKNLKNYKQVGDLNWDSNGQIVWTQKKTGDITHYPLKNGDDPTGSIVIWEHPNKEATAGLYIGGLDSYDFDSSGTTSLGSCFIYKRTQNLEQYSDIIVAEYTGRPATAEIFYENVRKLLIYYNATLMYENQNKGVFAYFTQKHCDYLLADQPDIINDVISNSKVQRKKGCHMNKQLKQWGEGLIKDWLNDLDKTGKKNVYNILSEPLLEELLAYSENVNTDRCILENTVVTTEEGFKLAKDIKLGDKLLTHTGANREVIYVDKHVYTGNMVQLRLQGDYRVLTCTANHPIYVGYSKFKSHYFRKDAIKHPEWVRADCLNYKYQFALLPKRKGLANIDLSDDVLYLLGWVMSDGYVAKDSNIVRITYQINQLDCAKRCLNIIEDYLVDEKYYFSINGKRKIDRKPAKIFRYKNCWRLEVASKKLHDLCKWFGCNPNSKYINHEIYNKYGNLMPFIIGWLEGDGHQRLNCNYDGHTRNGIELSTIYEELIHQCRQILIDHGIYSSIRKVKTRGNYRDQYSILISNEFVNKTLSYYESLKFVKIQVLKNTCRCIETKDGFWTPIKLLNIYQDTIPVINFEVNTDHSYVAEGIAVHNCMSLMQLMIYREQLYNVVVKEKAKVNKSRQLFDGPIFAQSWFANDEPKRDFEDNVYTF